MCFGMDILESDFELNNQEVFTFFFDNKIYTIYKPIKVGSDTRAGIILRNIFL